MGCDAERDAIYANPDATEEDYMEASHLEAEYGEMGGYESESDAASFLSGLGIKDEMHQMLMKDIPSNMKVGTAGAGFVWQSRYFIIRWAYQRIGYRNNQLVRELLADYENVVLVVSHDRHFLMWYAPTLQMWDRQKIKIFTGNYSFWYESSQLMARQISDRNKKSRRRKRKRPAWIYCPFQR